jgi:hypothetical protein
MESVREVGDLLRGITRRSPQVVDTRCIISLCKSVTNKPWPACGMLKQKEREIPNTKTVIGIPSFQTITIRSQTVRLLGNEFRTFINGYLGQPIYRSLTPGSLGEDNGLWSISAKQRDSNSNTHC